MSSRRWVHNRGQSVERVPLREEMFGLASFELEIDLRRSTLAVLAQIEEEWPSDWRYPRLGPEPVCLLCGSKRSEVTWRGNITPRGYPWADGMPMGARRPWDNLCQGWPVVRLLPCPIGNTRRYAAGPNAGAHLTTTEVAAHVWKKP